MERHPQLADKLNLLYLLQLNPRIRNDSSLARGLSISRQTVSKWRIGSSTSRGNSIPIGQTRPVAELFEIEHEWLSLPYDEFESKVRARCSQLQHKSEQPSKEISISMLPSTGLNIIGRDVELSKLSEYWDIPQTNVVQVVAFGGAGKSALINRWLSDLGRKNYGSAQRIYAWSFYWQGDNTEPRSSGDYFIEHSLAWFGDEQPSVGSPWAKATRLANLIKSTKTLLILDGLEPLQHPPGEKFGQIENSAVALLIKELAAGNKGLCVITTRYPVAELHAFSDGRGQTISLPRLSTRDGVQLLVNVGINGRADELAAAVERYSGHALSLSLVSGFLSVVHDGNISQLSEMTSLFDAKHQQHQIRSIMQDYLLWLEGKAELQFLRLLSLLGRATSLKNLKTLFQYKKIDGVTDKLFASDKNEILYIIQELKDANLISKSRSGPQAILDCHPLVRDAVGDHLSRQQHEHWLGTHSLIFEWLQTCSPKSPQSMAEFEPLFRAVIYGVKSGRHLESFNLYYEDIKRRQFSIFAEGSHHADQDCLKSFFEVPWDLPIKSLPDEAQNYLLISVATNLIYLGDIQEAIRPSEKSIKWFANNQRYLEASIAAAPLLSMYIASGNLVEAEELIHETENVVLQSGSEVAIAMGKVFKAYLAHLRGETEFAKEYFIEADSVITNLSPHDDAQFPTISSYFCKFLLDIGDVAQSLSRSLQTFAWRNRKSWQVSVDTTSILASDILVLGLTFLAMGDKVNAKLQLDKQVDLFKRADEWLYLPTGLNGRAKYYLAVENFEAAIQDLEEALEISKRTGARFGEWETYLELAKVHVTMGDLERGREFLSKAQALPNMKNFKFRDQEIEWLEQELV
jgi:tetratricopeptide (TPR) repeat protein